MKNLDYLAIKLCERLPLNIALFEKNGFCQNQLYNCKYREEKIKIFLFVIKKIGFLN